MSPEARARRLRRELPELLSRLEGLGVTEIRTRRRSGDEMEEAARGLGVASATQGGTTFPGSIYVTLELSIERMAGFVADNDDALALWLGEFLAEPGQEDVRAKLARSGADERHVVVFLPGFTTAPFAASALLLRFGCTLPDVAPSLPTEVSHVWAVSMWASGDGMRWSPSVGWTRFPKLQP